MNGVPTAWRVHRCASFLSRSRGRLGASLAQANWAWLLHPCRAVHTCFMGAPLDVVFCDARQSILRIDASMAPWRFAVERDAGSVWEFPAGAAATLRLRRGDRLTLCR
ncbi:MAG TPA: DUF192 domain-containing protein [Burkholderiaceae bacterium]|nr:DUF192 domain-containing protein [Burkholderiaceae bacterium]